MLALSEETPTPFPNSIHISPFATDLKLVALLINRIPRHGKKEKARGGLSFPVI
jgi:hypothetical protein